MERFLKFLRRLFKKSKNRVSISRLNRFVKQKKDIKDISKEPRDTISVVIPCYSHEKYLAETLQSILSQTTLPDELVIINDCSPDNSEEIIMHFVEDNKEKFSNGIQYIKNRENLGQATSLNIAIEKSSSDLIMILNDDDYLFHDVIELMLKLFKQNRDIALIGAHSLSINESQDMSEILISDICNYSEIDFTKSDPFMARGYKKANDLCMTHSGSTFLKIAWKEVGGYRLLKDRIICYSDRDFQMRINLLYKVMVAYKVPFSYWRTDSSVDANLNS